MNKLSYFVLRNALRKNSLLQSMVEEVFNLPLELSPCIEEAATGAAINAIGRLQ